MLFLRVMVMEHASWKVHPVTLLQLPVLSIDTPAAFDRDEIYDTPKKPIDGN